MYRHKFVPFLIDLIIVGNSFICCNVITDLNTSVQKTNCQGSGFNLW
nr:MAG TPA: hypothetical protein [Caudoviricetes sp.]DAU85012.1 MAG TPA: hypothetical protein [Caudoviricetes sp.]